MLNFPLNPTNGLTYSIDDHVWSWNGYAWEKVVQAGGGGTGPVGPTGATGATGADSTVAGPIGATGFPPGLPYTALTGVFDTPNAAGKSKFISSNAKFFNTDSDGSGLTGYFNAATRGRLHVVSQTNPSSFLLYDYTSVTEGSSIYTFTGSLVANNGFNVASSPFDTGNCRIFYVNDGVTGAAGATGATGPNIGSYTGQIETASIKEYTLDPVAATARTITGFYIQSGNQSGSGGGSGTFILKVKPSVGSEVTVKSVTVNNSSGAQSSLANTSVSADARIFLHCTANSAAVDVVFSVEYSL